VFNPAELVRPNLGQRVLPQRAVDLNIVPELPASAKLTDAQLQQADGVGKCLNDYIATLAADTPACLSRLISTSMLLLHKVRKTQFWQIAR
jgi:hypothetical protein